MIHKFVVLTFEKEIEADKAKRQIRGLLKKMPMSLEISDKEAIISFDEEKTDEQIEKLVKILFVGENIVHIRIFKDERDLIKYLFYR